MLIGVHDADFFGRKGQRFPNLACMKLSAHHKGVGDTVELVGLNIDPHDYDRVYVSKVFTDTGLPDWVGAGNVVLGGTGIAFDKAPNLPDAIEHCMPDYSLYDAYVGKGTAWRWFRDYSIGFLTRGCFRHCGFCVNQNSDRSLPSSPLEEFFDEGRKKICLLDDNFFACSEWERLLGGLIETGRRFQFKQGMDLRLMTQPKCEMLFGSRYDGEFTFAFDSWDDRDAIERKLYLCRGMTDKPIRLYVLCGYDKNGRYDAEFWERDLEETFLRVQTLFRYRCLPYVMRFERYLDSPWRGVYVELARWLNQPSFAKSMSFWEFCTYKENGSGAPYRYLSEYLMAHPHLNDTWLTMRFGDV